MVKERPIIFSGPMIRAILDGRKTQTRRVVKPQPQLINGKFEMSSSESDAWPEPCVWLALTPSGKFGLNAPPYYKCPYGNPGDRLWVRETWRPCGDDEMSMARIEALRPSIAYKADEEWDNDSKWKPSIHMPRWASRILLEITDIRVERLKEISGEDACLEGTGFIDRRGDLCHAGNHPSYSISIFSRLWDSINGKKPGCSWANNPWVWVVEFKKVGDTEA